MLAEPNVAAKPGRFDVQVPLAATGSHNRPAVRLAVGEIGDAGGEVLVIDVENVEGDTAERADVGARACRLPCADLFGVGRGVVEAVYGRRGIAGRP